MKLALAILLLSGTLATILPLSHDDLVPEINEVETESEFEVGEYSLMQSRLDDKGPDECKIMAKASEKAVNNARDEAQLLLDNSVNADRCSTKGDSAVTGAEKAVTESASKKVAADEEYTKAMHKKVDFGTPLFQDIKENDCKAFYTSAGFTSAKVRVTAAQALLTRAADAIKDSALSLANGKIARTLLQHVCYCAARSLYSSNLADAQEDLETGQGAAWKEAHLLVCVLAKTSEKDCNIPAFPQLTSNSEKLIKYNGKCLLSAKTKKVLCQKGCGRVSVTACKRGKKAFRTTKTGKRVCSYRRGSSCKCQKLVKPKLQIFKGKKAVLSRCNAKLGCQLVTRKFCKKGKKGKKVLRRNKRCRFSRRTVCRCPSKSGGPVISWK
jgi:hypothetical protein